MSTTLDDRIREAVAELAESVDEPEPFLGMPLARRPIPWWRRPVVVSAAAAMVVVVLVGVPLFLVYGGDEVTTPKPSTTEHLGPATVADGPVVAYQFAYHELDGPPIGESVMVPIVVFEPAVGDDPLRTVERALSRTFPFHSTTVPLIRQHGAIDIDGFEVDPTAAWWPLGIRLTGVSLDGSLLTVRVSKEWGAITRVPDQLPPATVVFAATKFDFVDSVQIEVAGEMLGGGPFTRADYDQVSQGVFLETPAIRQAVSSPVIISGSSTVAEDPVGYEIVTDRKVVIAVGLVDAGCAPECAGDFTIAVPYALDEQGRQGWVAVFTQGSDGERQNVIHYRVSFAANAGSPALPRDVTSRPDRSFVLPEVA
jgi:hypothetical protein